MSTAPIIIERRLQAPVSRVWKALTDSKELPQWYFNIPDFRPEAGYAFSFTGGDEARQFVHLCRITKVVQEKLLAYTWSYADFPYETIVTIELFPEGEDTRLRLTHEGTENIPTGLPQFRRESFESGWAYIIGTSLKNFVEKKNATV